MNDKVVIDTNLWVYLYAHHPEEKSLAVRQLLQDHFSSVVCSSQVLGELFHVLTRKKFSSIKDAKDV